MCIHIYIYIYVRAYAQASVNIDGIYEVFEAKIKAPWLPGSLEALNPLWGLPAPPPPFRCKTPRRVYSYCDAITFACILRLWVQG